MGLQAHGCRPENKVALATGPSIMPGAGCPRSRFGDLGNHEPHPGPRVRAFSRQGEHENSPGRAPPRRILSKGGRLCTLAASVARHSPFHTLCRDLPPPGA